jgi:hypothetical protein
MEARVTGIVVMKDVPGTFMEFDTPAQVVLNIVANALLVLAVIDVLRRPAVDWRWAPFNKWLTLGIVVWAGIPGGIHGVYVPIGPVIYAVWILPKLITGHRDGRDNDPDDAATAHRVPPSQ